jgi:hypothetical protein
MNQLNFQQTSTTVEVEFEGYNYRAIGYFPKGRNTISYWILDRRKIDAPRVVATLFVFTKTDAFECALYACEFKRFSSLSEIEELIQNLKEE